MAAPAALNAVFVRLGFHADACALILDEGYDTFESLGELEDKDIDQMISKLSKLYAPNHALPVAQDPNRNRRFTTRAVLNFKAMTYWIREQKRIGGSVTPGDFTDAVLATVKQRIRDNALLDKSLGQNDLPKPPMLKDWSEWPKFKNLFTTYVGQIRGVALCPITYVIRETPEVTNEVRNAVYVSDTERLIRCTLLEGHWYRQDNMRFWNEMKSYLIDGPGWAFVQQYDRTKDGRSAWNALILQAEGDATKNLRKQRAYAAIANARYLGDRPRFTLIDYIAIHQRAYNELAELGEPVPESKKVTDFMTGLQDPALQSSKAVIIGNPKMLESFDEAQTFMQKMQDTVSAQKRAVRTVAAVEVGSQPQAKEKAGGKPRRQHHQQQRSSSGGNTPRIHAGNYSHAQWKALSAEEQEEVRELRKQQKQKKRKVSSTSSGQQEQPSLQRPPAPLLLPPPPTERRVSAVGTTSPTPILRSPRTEGAGDPTAPASAPAAADAPRVRWGAEVNAPPASGGWSATVARESPAAFVRPTQSFRDAQVMALQMRMAEGLLRRTMEEDRAEEHRTSFRQAWAVTRSPSDGVPPFEGDGKDGRSGSGGGNN